MEGACANGSGLGVIGEAARPGLAHSPNPGELNILYQTNNKPRQGG
jgi:hypothetical protein